MFSWLTGSGVLKEDDFEDDKDTLVEYYQNEGYIDFAIKDIKFDYISPKWMIIRFIVSEGRQYKVGTLTSRATRSSRPTILSKASKMDRKLMKSETDAGRDLQAGGVQRRRRDPARHVRLAGAIWTSEQRRHDDHQRHAHAPTRPPAPSTLPTISRKGEKCYIEKIIIKGNTKTKDQVLRRELAVYPGEVYDMVRVKISKSSPKQMEYFEKVDTKAAGHRCAEPQGPGHRRGGEEHRQFHHRRRFQFGGKHRRLRRAEAGQFRFVQSADLHRRRAEIRDESLRSGRLLQDYEISFHRTVVPGQTTYLQRGSVSPGDLLHQPEQRV